MTLNVPEILEELRLNRGYFPREAVEAAVERREEMVPELLRILGGSPPRPDGALWPPDAKPFVREGPKVGRNDPCPCGSGKKYKRCCGARGGG